MEGGTFCTSFPRTFLSILGSGVYYALADVLTQTLCCFVQEHIARTKRGPPSSGFSIPPVALSVVLSVCGSGGLFSPLGRFSL